MDKKIVELAMEETGKIVCQSAGFEICPVCGNRFPHKNNKRYCSPECASVAGRMREKYRKSKEEKGWRKCHDCGKPTSNYRCDECWNRILKNEGIALADREEDNYLDI